MSDNSMFKMPEHPVKPRWYTLENKDGNKGSAGKANFGRKGAACTVVPQGEMLVLADIKGSGMIRRIWITISERDAKSLRSMKIEMYWDGAKTPAVQGPIGDFFCHSHGQMVRFENACFSSPEGRSFNSTVPMPFREGGRIQLVNESDKDIVVYYDVNATIGDKHDDKTLYFHSYWRRENPTTIRQDMAILPLIKGRGRFLGCNLGVKTNKIYNKFWWGEGEVKVYLDGDSDYPTMAGTGTEDYIGTAWGQGHFVNMYQGNHYVAGDVEVDDTTLTDAYGYYRFHIPDPIYFYQDIKVDIQVMGGAYYHAMIENMEKYPDTKFMKAGDGSEFYTEEEVKAKPEHAGLFERTDDHCATAYWYMDSPENGLEAIAEVKKRTENL